MTYKENIKPIYLQIADRICDAVMNGTYRIDDRIPSVREYAASMQVNANTVMRTYMYLADEGIISNKRGIGFFIQPDAKVKIEAMRKETFFNDEAIYFFSRLASMDVSPDKLKDIYNDYLKNKINEDYN